ncbi:hypothetical protein LUX32_07120 [Actinomadura madurae]|nr:hypothetical protein [Actinomadura madurae]MCP9977436.1 hypothetical protein [Actinomadura madurae]
MPSAKRVWRLMYVRPGRSRAWTGTTPSSSAAPCTRGAGTARRGASSGTTPMRWRTGRCGCSAAVRWTIPPKNGRSHPRQESPSSPAGLDARGHITFGGRLTSDATGFLASKIAQRTSGDYRNRDRVDAWAADIARELRGAAV